MCLGATAQHSKKGILSTMKGKKRVNIGDTKRHRPPWECGIWIRNESPKAGHHKMIQARSVIRRRVLLSRSYASAASPHALVFLEHNNGVITSGSLSALTAATKLGGQVTGLLVGSPEQVPNAVEKAKKYRHHDSFPSSS